MRPTTATPIALGLALLACGCAGLMQPSRPEPGRPMAGLTDRNVLARLHRVLTDGVRAAGTAYWKGDWAPGRTLAEQCRAYAEELKHRRWDARQAQADRLVQGLERLASDVDQSLAAAQQPPQRQPAESPPTQGAWPHDSASNVLWDLEELRKGGGPTDELLGTVAQGTLSRFEAAIEGHRRADSTPLLAAAADCRRYAQGLRARQWGDRERKIVALVRRLNEASNAILARLLEVAPAWCLGRGLSDEKRAELLELYKVDWLEAWRDAILNDLEAVRTHGMKLPAPKATARPRPKASSHVPRQGGLCECPPHRFDALRS